MNNMSASRYDLSSVPKNAKERYERGQYILKLSKELPEQRTPEWYTERRTCLTASEIHSVLTCRNMDTNKGVNEMIESKKGTVKKQSFSDSQSTRWGEKYEPTSVQIFEKKFNVKVHEAPLLIKGNIGASCDGIVMIESNTEKDTECIEIKNPFSRDPVDIPANYMSQMQTQLYVTGLSVCNYFDCKVEEWLDENEFIDDVQCYLNSQDTDTDTSVYGIIAQFVNLHKCKALTDPNSYNDYKVTIDPNVNFKIVPKHLYSKIVSADFSDYNTVKSELDDRVTEQMQCEGMFFIRYYYWKLVKYNHVRVDREEDWYDKNKDKIAMFWSKVQS